MSRKKTGGHLRRVDRSPPPQRNKAATSGGFTLLEMLITLLLTALIGTVLFSTYRNVAESRKEAQAYIEAREHPRMFRAILDDDLCSMLMLYDKRLPLLSRRPIQIGEEYTRAPGAATPEKELDDEELLLSFAATSGLFAEGRAPAAGLYCIEYALKDHLGKRAFVRREREHCGVEGAFAWKELPLLPSVWRVTAEIWPDGEDAFLTEWAGMRSSDDVPRAIRFQIWHSAEQTLPETLVIKLPDRFHNAP